MTDTEINQTIAVRCGWKPFQCNPVYDIRDGLAACKTLGLAVALREYYGCDCDPEYCACPDDYSEWHAEVTPRDEGDGYTALSDTAARALALAMVDAIEKGAR